MELPLAWVGLFHKDDRLAFPNAKGLDHRRGVGARYNIVNEADLKAAATRLTEYFEQEKVTLLATLKELAKQVSGPLETKLVETSTDEDGAGERN